MLQGVARQDSLFIEALFCAYLVLAPSLWVVMYMIQYSFSRSLLQILHSLIQFLQLLNPLLSLTGFGSGAKFFVIQKGYKEAFSFGVRAGTRPKLCKHLGANEQGLW